MVQVNKSSHRVRFQLTSIVSRSCFSIMVTCYQTCKLTEQKRSSPLGHIGGETSRLPRIRKGVSHQLFAFTMGRWSHKELPKKELLHWHTNIHRRVLIKKPRASHFHFCKSWVSESPLKPWDWDNTEQRGTDVFGLHYFIPFFVLHLLVLNGRSRFTCHHHCREVLTWQQLHVQKKKKKKMVRIYLCNKDTF